MKDPMNRRLVFTAKDLKDVTGFGIVKCREMMRAMRKVYRLKKHEYVLVFHAAKYLNAPIKELLSVMR